MKKVVMTAIVFGIVAAFSFILFFSMNQKEAAASPDIFKDLQPMPKDMDLIINMIQSGNFPDMCDVEEKYWKRPEFYPSWDRAYEMFYRSPDYSTWGVHGYGVFPSSLGYSVRNIKMGDKITFCAFLMTGWKIESYQGISINGIGDEYWEVNVNPDTLLLSKTFPKIDNNWVHKIEVVITAKEDVPKGIYDLGFSISGANPEVDKEYRNYVMEKAREIASSKEFDEEYVKRCSEFENIRKNITFENCKALYRERLNNYVTGGAWQTSTMPFKLEVEVI